MRAQHFYHDPAGAATNVELHPSNQSAPCLSIQRTAFFIISGTLSGPPACPVVTHQTDLSYKNDNSRIARFKRVLRNPSMITVILIALAAATVVLAPFAPGWAPTFSGQL